ncbi:tyrosine-type recombinase/integrase [Acinetobacter sp. CFCC 10889]|uniref:tyrosine-type recombinase/integrase n=1 Tax=Acinetobacter sp. CFCC 10889 TaxID=1775557 RepID=UPI000DD0C536|nr:integrase family protein [Acinetobacter sp. CFCC 10889]
MPPQRVKLTKSFIDQLELKPAIYRDSELIGFAVRVNNNYKTYIVEKKVLGKAIRSTLGLHGNITLAQARELAREQLFLMSQGVNPNDRKKKKILDGKDCIHLEKQKPTVKEAFANYFSLKSLRPRSIEDYTIVCDQYLEDWQNIKLDEISSKMIQEKHANLSKSSKAQADMAMRVFRAIYNFSIEHYLDDHDHPILTAYNPVKTLSAKKVWNKIRQRKTYINEDQMSDWIRAIIKYEDRGQALETNRDFLLTLVLTGFRRNECESLLWSNIDLTYGNIISIDSKNGEPYTLPMGDFLFELMKKRRRYVQSDWVFPSARSASGHIENISKVRVKINELCDVKFTFHDLRRTFGSIAESLDYGRYTIKRLLNHKKDEDSKDVTTGDIQVSDKRIREAMNEIEDIILNHYKKEYIYKLKAQ